MTINITVIWSTQKLYVLRLLKVSTFPSVPINTFKNLKRTKSNVKVSTAIKVWKSHNITYVCHPHTVSSYSSIVVTASLMTFYIHSQYLIGFQPQTKQS